MKKYAFIFAAIACLGLAASCQKDNTPAEDNTNVITFTASIDPVGGVKPGKAVIDGVTPKWETDDQIRVYCFDDTNDQYRVATKTFSTISKRLVSGGSSTATFEMNVSDEYKHFIDEADFFWGIFKGSFGSSNLAADKRIITSDSDRAFIRFNYPGADGTEYQDNDAVQVRIAYSTNRNLHFQNVFHLLRFTPNLNSGATKAVLTRIDGGDVARYQANVFFDSSTGDIISIVPVGGPVASVTRALVSGENYFALIPGMTLTGGFKIELKDDGDNVIQTFTYAHDLTTARNKITTISNFDDRVVDAAGKAVLKNGTELNVALKNLADGGSPSYYTDNTSITSIVVNTRSSVNTGTLVSASTSAMPIYANYDAGVITLSTPSNKVYFPENANSSFYQLKGLASVDMNKMSTEDVVNAGSMFYFSALTSFGNIELPNATNTNYMFNNCTSLETVGTLNLPLVGTAENMFSGCSSLQSMGDVNLPAATTVKAMFSNCTVLAAVGSVNIPVAENVNGMFNECRALATIGTVQMDAASNAGYMFGYCQSLASLTLNGVDNNTLSNLNYMFAGCLELATLNFAPVSDKVTNTERMFYGCGNLESVDISHLSGNVTNVLSMFQNCTKLDGIVFNSGFNTSSVATFASMFSGCQALTSLDLSMFDTSAAESMYQMFFNCRELTTIGASTRFVTTASLTNTASMFAGCLKLASVDLTGLAGHPTSMQSMFSSCQSLTTIHLSNDFNTEAVPSYASVFDFCTSLNQLYIKGFHLTKGVIGTNSSQLTSRFMNALRNVPSSCTIHYTTNNSSTEYDVRYYLPYSTTSGTGTGGYNWTTAN